MHVAVIITAVAVSIGVVCDILMIVVNWRNLKDRHEDTNPS